MTAAILIGLLETLTKPCTQTTQPNVNEANVAPIQTSQATIPQAINIT